MFKRLLYVKLFLTIFLSASAQKQSGLIDYFSYHVSLSDYSSLSNNKSSGTAPWYQLEGKSLGFGINAWKNFRRNIDLSGGFNFTFSNFPIGFVKNDSIGQGKISTQLDALAHLYATSEKSRFRPFVTGGLGAGIFANKAAFFAPIGLGLQINFNEGARLMLQAQIRNKISGGISQNFLFYNLGITQTLSRNKKKKETIYQKEEEVEIISIAPSDMDEDGILDVNDKCPTVKGTINGCPDRDGDLIPDENDDCPDEPGTINGCPDSDGDNIMNKLDSCPDVAGIIKYNGCPIPDKDGDGVNDEEDKCPNEIGTASNNGCPEIKEEIKRKIDYTAKNILFRSGSASMRSASYIPLNELIVVLKENPTIIITIEAHTDNMGTTQNNQLLSERRAKTVADYLILKGISADRVTWSGFGETLPIADNETENGRAQNRRVEFKLRNE
jgi:outer membrane protein OmpA-like peptidoglycan-associated protein